MRYKLIYVDRRANDQEAQQARQRENLNRNIERGKAVMGFLDGVFTKHVAPRAEAAYKTHVAPKAKEYYHKAKREVSDFWSDKPYKRSVKPARR